jgi:MerR family transcriptional regulator, light-induced transcriptional regulator
MEGETSTLGPDALQNFLALRSAAIDAVTERFCTTHGGVYAAFGARGRQACRDDLAFHLDFLRPVLEFGLIEPMVDYLRWLAVVLDSRDIPAEHLPLSLDWLAEFFAARMSDGGGTTVAGSLARAKTQYLLPNDAPTAIYAHMPQPWDECAAFEDALLDGDRRGAGDLLDRCLDQGHSLVEAELHLIQPALYNVGRQWQNNQVSVAQEHMATAISQTVMNLGLLRSSAPPANGKRVLLACVEGNHHAVGLQMVSDAFQLAGWDVQYLGGNVPTRALLQHVARVPPDLLALSVSFAHDLHVVRTIITQLYDIHGDKRPAVIIGGLAINRFNLLVDHLGADGWSPNAGGAIARANHLVSRATT